VKFTIPAGRESVFARSFGAPPVGFEPTHTAPETMGGCDVLTRLTCTGTLVRCSQGQISLAALSR
jgi:hypothetical protein